MITASTIEAHGTEKALQDLGFKGRALQDLSTLITTQEGIEDLESFIIDTEGEYTNSMSIACGYRRLKILQSTMDAVSFVYGYNQNGEMEDKILHLQDLLKCCVCKEDVARFENGLRTYKFDRLSFYHAFISEPLIPIKRLCTEAEMQSGNLKEIEEPTNW